MKLRNKKLFIVPIGFVLLSMLVLFAETDKTSDSKSVESLETRIQTLESEIRQLKKQQKSVQSIKLESLKNSNDLNKEYVDRLRELTENARQERESILSYFKYISFIGGILTLLILICNFLGIKKSIKSLVNEKITNFSKNLFEQNEVKKAVTKISLESQLDYRIKKEYQILIFQENLDNTEVYDTLNYIEFARIEMISPNRSDWEKKANDADAIVINAEDNKKNAEILDDLLFRSSKKPVIAIGIHIPSQGKTNYSGFLTFRSNDRHPYLSFVSAKSQLTGNLMNLLLYYESHRKK